MDNKEEKIEKEEGCCESSGGGCGCGGGGGGCGDSGGGCGGGGCAGHKSCCAGKSALVLVLLLVGGLIGYAMGIARPAEACAPTRLARWAPTRRRRLNSLDSVRIRPLSLETGRGLFMSWNFFFGGASKRVTGHACRRDPSNSPWAGLFTTLFAHVYSRYFGLLPRQRGLPDQRRRNSFRRPGRAFYPHQA